MDTKSETSVNETVEGISAQRYDEKEHKKHKEKKSCKAPGYSSNGHAAAFLIPGYEMERKQSGTPILPGLTMEEAANGSVGAA